MSMTASAARPWTAFYAPGMRPELDGPPFHALGEMCTAAARAYGRATAFTCVMPNGMHGNLSFEEVDRLSDAFAVWLREAAGCRPGDRVALQAPNGLAFPVVAFGTFKAGCVLVNVNPLYSADEMGRTFADAEPTVLVVVDMFADKLPDAFRSYAVPNVVLTRVAEFFPPMVRTVIGLVQKHWNRQIPPATVPHIRLDRAIGAGERTLREKRLQVASYGAELGPSSLAVLQYTGGTTGVSKGAMLTHGNILMNVAQTMEMVGQNIARGEETVMTALPLYHIFAFTVNFLGFWWLGARNVLIPSPRPLSNLRRAFDNHRITWMTGVNTLFNGLCNETWFTDSPPKHLRASAAGGMALQGAVAERWETVTRSPVIEGYGLTETSPVVCFNPFGRAKRETIGIPVPSTDVACLDDAGNPVPRGEPGELAVKGPQVMAGYWRRPDETEKVLKDGWLRTGDIATVDEDGYIRIVDRKKDMILVSGFNVFPNEVEEAIVRHPGVVEAAVVGVPDGASGEAVQAFVVRRDPNVTEAEVRRFCREHMAAYKVPRTVVFRDELPKSNVGKILRKDLRAEARPGPAPGAPAAGG
jgi:long-chain acyl-CoA synthetase